jgi:hypothetical protein
MEDETMKQQPSLSEDEWTLVIDLLEREQQKLPHEIHHTDLRTYRKELVEREQLVNQLLERLRQASS